VLPSRTNLVPVEAAGAIPCCDNLPLGTQGRACLGSAPGSGLMPPSVPLHDVTDTAGNRESAMVGLMAEWSGCRARGRKVAGSTWAGQPAMATGPCDAVPMCCGVCDKRQRAVRQSTSFGKLYLLQDKHGSNATSIDESPRSITARLLGPGVTAVQAWLYRQRQDE